MQHVNRRRAGLSFLWDWAKIFTISVVLFFVHQTFLVEAFKIPSGSMERTLLVGDFLLVNKVVYGAEVPLGSKRLPATARPQRGDVIVFEWPKDPHEELREAAGRIAGRHAGDARRILIRNGVASAEPYVSHSDPEADPVWEDSAGRATSSCGRRGHRRLPSVA